MLFTRQQIGQAEEAAIARGNSEEALMDKAGRGIAGVIAHFFPRPGTLVVFAGKGHNAGDAFVAAAHLLEAGWRVCVRAAYGEATLAPLARRKWDAIQSRCTADVPASGGLVLLDGLLGVGAEGALREPILSACQTLNSLRQERHANTVAVDLPSGVDPDTGACDPNAVVADITCAIGLVKQGLCKPAALNRVGRLAVVSLPELEPADANETERVLTPRLLRSALPKRRPFSMHKGQAGRVGILAGSRGLVGAARLCAEGAVRGGAGLVTLCVPADIYDVTAGSTAPEVMVRPVHNYDDVWNMDFDVLAIGPGLGQSTTRQIQSFMLTDPRPAVLDAEALSILAAKHTGILAKCKAPRLLTPHFGEMRRLLESWRPEYVSLSQREQAVLFTDHFPVTLLYKGARTIIKAPGEPVSYNSTGHPGMAAGGFGDVLTGMTAALLAQGCSPYAAACLGSWLLGRGAELAIFNGSESPESLCPSDVLEHLGAAFQSLRIDEY
ncbi:MAG: NAD(P)H-hydrate dehydratase [Verrucomicrobiales bacterium]